MRTKTEFNEVDFSLDWKKMQATRQRQCLRLITLLRDNDPNAVELLDQFDRSEITGKQVLEKMYSL
jgi:hypothetical protein